MTELFIIIGSLVGGLIGIAGSFITFWYQTKKAGQVRFDQLLAEKQLNAGQEAYEKLDKIKGMLLQPRSETTSEQMLEYNKWFSGNSLYLSDEFSKKWEVIRDNLLKLKQLYEREIRDNNEIGELEDSVNNTIKEAKSILQRIYKKAN